MSERTTLIKSHKQGGLYTVRLPEQRMVNRPEVSDYPYLQVYPPVTVRLLVDRGNSEMYAVENALHLLETLFAHGVVDVKLLRLILRATGQQELEMFSGPAEASALQGEAHEG